MSAKTSIYLSDPLLRAIGPYGGPDGPSLSGRLATIGERYSEILERARPQFTRAEWCVILDVNNGHFEGLGAAGLGTLMWANVADAVEDGIGQKWGLTDDQVRALAARMRAMPQAAMVSVCEACEQFWLRSALPTDEAMAAAGIKPADGKP